MISFAEFQAEIARRAGGRRAASSSEEHPVELAEALWGALATAMRYALATRRTRSVRIPVIELLRPVAHQLETLGYDRLDVSTLAQYLTGKRVEFPFGTMAVDRAGVVAQLDPPAEGKAARGVRTTDRSGRAKSVWTLDQHQRQQELLAESRAPRTSASKRSSRKA